MWIFRNKNKYLAATNIEPIKGNEIFSTAIGSYVMPLPEDEFPEITWENSPVNMTSLFLNGDYSDLASEYFKKQQDKEMLQSKTPNEIDWEQVRINAAISALNGLISNPNHCGKSYESEVTHAIKYADALINELKKN